MAPLAPLIYSDYIRHSRCISYRSEMFTTIIILSEYNKSCTTALHLLRMLNWEITWLGKLYIFLLLRIFARSIFNIGPASSGSLLGGGSNEGVLRPSNPALVFVPSQVNSPQRDTLPCYRFQQRHHRRYEKIRKSLGIDLSWSSSLLFPFLSFVCSKRTKNL